MDMPFSDLLRWFLLGIGVLVIAVVYWISRRAGDGNSFAVPRKLVGLFRAATAGAGKGSVRTRRAGRQVEPHVPQAGRHADATFNVPAQEPEIGGRLLVVHVQAKPQYQFTGPDILRVAEEARLERAAGSSGGFFQRKAPGVAPSPDDPPLFYMANMFNPGVFEWDAMESFSTAGLSLFAQLPGALPPLETFDELLECARLFADKLHGAVLDESRSDLTVQTIQHIKENLQAYAAGHAAPGAGT